jgi:hypothetical protein
MTLESPSTEPAAELLTRVADTRSAQDRAAAVHDQAIRDAAAAGHPLTSIASTLGVTNRKRLYTVLSRPPDDHPGPPPPTPVVFLRGAGATTTSWHDIETAMHIRGLNTVQDRQQAWNLARAGTPVILVDFSAGSRDVTVGRVKARWKTTATTRPLGQLLPRAERDRLAAAGGTWLDTPVTTEDRHADLPLADPDTATRLPNQSIDPDHLAKAAITQLQ